MNEEIIQASMNIILHAGDARLLCTEVAKAMADFNYELAEEKMKDAKKKITKAHKVQTNAIQEESGGNEREYTLLFAHAQDTLMTVYSEINTMKYLLKIFKSYEIRITELERKIK